MTENLLVALDDYERMIDPRSWENRLHRTMVRSETGPLVDDDLYQALRGATVVVAMRERTAFPRSLFEQLPDLRLLVTTGSRNASIDLTAAVEHGVTVCHTSPVNSSSTAELTWALVLSMARNLPSAVSALRRGGWEHTLGVELQHKTLGVVGLGNVGSRVARYGLAFDMEVIAWSPHLQSGRAKREGVRKVTKEELFAASDIVSLHLVLSDSTAGVVGQTELELMKSTALFVNTSRAGLVDHEALVARLGGGHLAGAALDVFHDEPLPSGSLLPTTPGVLASPHLGYVTRETMTAWYADVLENVEAWLRGEPIRVLAGTGAGDDGL